MQESLEKILAKIMAKPFSCITRKTWKMGVKNSEKHFRRIEEYAPRTGVVRMLRLTEKQYENISMISGIEDLQERIVGRNCQILL